MAAPGVDVARLLLAAGADADAGHRQPALLSAIDRGSRELVRMLVEHGADLDATGHDGRRAREIVSTWPGFQL